MAVLGASPSVTQLSDEKKNLHQTKRDLMLETLDTVGIPYFIPQGAYYIFADISRFGYESDVDFTHYLLDEIGVAVVPGSSFFKQSKDGHSFIHFCFSKTPETLLAARERLLKI